jgi:hypothetical protein
MAKKSFEERMEAMHTPGAARSRKLGLPTMREAMEKVSAAQRSAALKKSASPETAAEKVASEKSERAGELSEKAKKSGASEDHKAAMTAHLVARAHHEATGFGDSAAKLHHKMAEEHAKVAQTAASPEAKKASGLKAFRDKDKPEHSLQQGAKGGQYYLSEGGKKVYVGKK